MENHKKKTIYNKSLAKIFFWSGFDVLVILLIACIALALIAVFYNRLDAVGSKLMLWCFLMVAPVSYALPTISLLKVWRQERILDVYWKDRTDQNRPIQERDWYLSFERAGFLLYHRGYIQRIVKTQEVEQTTEWGREKLYCMRFEDVIGKKHTIKFSSADAQNRFRQWYQNQARITENNEAE